MNLRILSRVAPTIWGRLLLMIGSIVVVVWMVLAASMYFFWLVQNDYSDLAQDHIPRLALASELAQGAAQLAGVAIEIFAEPNDAGTQIETDLRRVTDEMGRMLNDPLTAELSGGQTSDTTDLQDLMQNILAGLDQRRAGLSLMNTRVDQLRLLNVDIQDEIDPLLSDYAFNIEIATENLSQRADSDERLRLARRIIQERALRDRIAMIGSEASTATTLTYQISVAITPAQLDQMGGLAADSLSRLNALLAELPEKTEYLTLTQSVRQLNILSHSGAGIFALRGAWLGNQAEVLAYIEQLQSGFSELQNNLGDISARQRQIVTEATRLSADRAGAAMVWLGVLTLLSGGIGVAILFGYIRGHILHPLNKMTLAMQAIADGMPIQGLPESGDDEIAQMGRSVAAFEHSVIEREAAIIQLRDTQNELVQAGKMAALGNLSAGVSHELNQPLSAMRHRLHLLEAAQENRDAEAIQRQITRISGLVDRMEATVKTLKRFARRSDYRSDDLVLGELLDNACAILRGKIDPEKITLTLSASAKDAIVKGDQMLIEQVIVNLLSNAVDAIMEKSPRGKIVVAATVKNKVVEITLSDDGAGLGDLSTQAAIDPFVTTKDIGEGLGLGLSISYNIAKDLGGDLRLERINSGGTRAVFELPQGRKN